MKKRLIAAIWLLLLPAAAADYQIKTVPLKPIEDYPLRVTLGGIIVAADPYGSDEKSYTAFDVKDLNSRGYFPIHVLVQNGSPAYATIRTRNIQLKTASAQLLYTLSATLVVQDIFKGGFTTRLPRMGSRDLSTSSRAGSPLVDFTSKELTSQQIAPGTMSHGFLFFFTPDAKKPLFAGATLVIPEIIDDSARKPIGPFEITLDAVPPSPGK